MAEQQQEEDLLIDREEYLSNGVHIGTKSKHKDMEKYIFHVKKNQLAVLDLNQTDERIRDAANFLSKYEAEEILIVSRSNDARLPVDLFCEEIGAEKITGRFTPGTLTNPRSDRFVEPDVVVVTDPEQDSQAINEARDAKIPVLGIADSSNTLEDIDIVIPANNKSGNAIATVYFLIAREMTDGELSHDLEDFKPETDEESE